MRTLVVHAATGYGLATVAAAAATGTFDPADRRVLVLSNDSAVPETAYGVDDVAGIGPLLAAFDDIYSYNAAVAPLHPTVWQPQADELPLWERALRALWSLEGDLHLVLAGIWGSPAVVLSQIFADATIDVYADGLTGYGPTRRSLPLPVSTRVQRLLHPDLLPGVTPLLLREYGVESVPLPTASLTEVLATVAAAAGPAGVATGAGRVAVLVAQDPAALGPLSAHEKRRLHLDMVEGAVAAGHTELVLKAHPSGPAGVTGPLVARAAELGARLRVRDSPELVETWYAAGEVDLAVGCCSTALATARWYDVPTARVGTELLLERLEPYETGLRLPAAVVTASVPPLAVLPGTPDPPPPVPLDALVTAVGYLMQPSRNPDLHGPAAQVLVEHGAALRPYLSQQRLTQVGLTGPADSAH